MQNVEPVRVSIRFQPPFLAEIDDYRRTLEQIPDRAEAIRLLVQQALASTKPSAKAARKASR